MTLRQALALTALPLAFTILLFMMLNASLPLWQVFNLDPDYFYLFNGLLIVEGLPPTDLAHPGTPVQVLIALVIRLLYFGEPAGAIVDAVLADPEHTLVITARIILPLVGVALFLMGRALLAATGRLWPALLGQTAPFLSMIIPKFALHPKPEAFLVIALCLLVVAATGPARAGKVETRHGVWMGIAMGFGLATKLTVLPLGLLPLVVLGRVRPILAYGIATILAFLVFVAPALPNAHLFFDWIHKVALYNGAYGEGAATVIDFAKYPRAIVKLFGSKLLFTVTLLLSLTVLALYRRRGESHPLLRLLAGIVVAQLASVLFVAKQPAPHYTIPMVMLSGPALACLWVLSRRLLPPRPHLAGWAVLSVVLLGLQGNASATQYRELRDWTRASQDFDMGRFAACGKVFIDTSSAASYAMESADKYIQGRYAARLDKVMPQDEYSWFLYDHVYWRRGLMRAGKTVDITDILARHSCVVFRGNAPYALLPELGKIPGFAVTDRCELGEESVLTWGVTCDGKR